MVDEGAARILEQLAASDRAAFAAPVPVNILLVDDEPKNLTALEALLTSPDCRLVQAGSGPEALRHLLRDDFAVILLDVHMPGMDGFETAELIRGRERSHATPIIFLTAANRGETFVAKGYALGAVDYILKPIDPHILRSKVAVFVELFKKTEQIKRQADQLAETATFLNSVLEGSTEYAILALDLDGWLLTWNEGARRIYGYGEGEVVGREKMELLHAPGGAASGSMAALLEAAQRGEKVEAEIEGMRKDGQCFWASLTIDRRRDAGGRPAGFVAIARDITHIKHAEQERVLLIMEQAARAEAERTAERTVRLQAITAALSEAASPAQVAEAAVRQGLETLHARAGVVAVVSEDDALNLIWVEGVIPELPRVAQRIPLAAATPLADATRERRVVSVVSPAELAVHYPALAETWLDAGGMDRAWVCLPLLAGEKALGAMMLTFVEEHLLTKVDHDFLLRFGRQCGQALERARLYEAEQAARATAEAAVRTRDEFLSIAAHELKNPVAVVKGSADLLRRTQSRDTLDPERLARFLSIIGNGVDRLTLLVDDLLDVARLQSGRLPLRRQPVDLAALLSDLIARQQVEGDRHRLRLEIVATPDPLLADPIRLDQVLVNLVGNALKYSPDGGEVRITLDRDGDGALISIHDEGIGLPPEEVELIFQPFGRASNAAARNVPGLGLGLYICRQIVESHQGRIWAESLGEGRGTIVSFWLPIAASIPTEEMDA